MDEEGLTQGVAWVEDGQVHIDVHRLLEVSGVPDTPQNRDLAVKICLEEFWGRFPGVPVIVVSGGGV